MTVEIIINRQVPHEFKLQHQKIHQIDETNELRRAYEFLSK